jgi:predicted AAA+ superfamily ATPase
MHPIILLVCVKIFMYIRNNITDILGMIARKYFKDLVQEALQIFPVCALIGPRQCGKTTLANIIKDSFDPVYHFDLEDPYDLQKMDSPKLLLESLEGLVIIDEIQLRPDLFPYLRVLVDKNSNIKLLILGSASQDLIRQSSETLAGRIQYIELTPFNIREVGDIKKLWERGGFPSSYLASSDDRSHKWRKAYIATFLERDLASMGFRISPQKMRKLWIMLAHYHGNIVNYSDLGRSLGLTDKTIRAHIEVLEGTFMVRCLRSWFENIKKRQVKAPKIYIRDSGLLHSLLGIQDASVAFHPKLGASWEGFALEGLVSTLEADSDDLYYWRTQNGAELDLLVFQGGKRIGYEFKYTDSPKVTLSMHIALKDLALNTLNIVVPGKDSFPIHERINVIGLDSLENN